MNENTLTDRFFNKMSLDSFSEREIISLMLSFVCSEKAAEYAGTLTSTFGTVRNILEADIDQLIKAGIDTECAGKIKFISCLAAKCKNQPFSDIDVRNFPAMYGLMYSSFMCGEESILTVLSVDENMKIISADELGTLSKNKRKKADYYGKQSARNVLKNGCELAILVHNHPYGKRQPTQADIILTRKIMVFLRTLDIILLDHYIVGKDGACSMRQLGLIYDIDQC